MWYFDVKQVLDLHLHIGEMLNSPFAFPRLPPRANPPLGISNVGKIKDSIIRDKDAMMEKLNANHAMFHRYAAGLFDMSTDRFSPGHPMHSQSLARDISEKSKRFDKENVMPKTSLHKETK